MSLDENVIKRTKDWVDKVVIGLNLCPFAKPVFDENKIAYRVHGESDCEDEWVLKSFKELDADDELETSLLIFPEFYDDFHTFLELVALAQFILEENNYEGVYQLAHFHPNYLFEGEDEGAVSHYTNRSPYPILHLLREESLTKALETYPNPESIPERNIAKLNELGLDEVKKLLG